jgi:hypothetical protein
LNIRGPAPCRRLWAYRHKLIPKGAPLNRSVNNRWISAPRTLARLRNKVCGIEEGPVGDVRVFYDVSGESVEVLAIVSKSEAAIWLEQFGKPE